MEYRGRLVGGEASLMVCGRQAQKRIENIRLAEWSKGECPLMTLLLQDMYLRVYVLGGDGLPSERFFIL